MKKKVISIALVIALIAVIAVGSFAYFTDKTQRAENTFTMGKVDITLTEPKWNENDTHTLVPGKFYEKDPTITLEDGSLDSYVYLDVSFNKYSSLFWVMAADASADANIDFTIFDNDGKLLPDFQNDNGVFSTTKFLQVIQNNTQVREAIVNKWFEGVDHDKWDIISVMMGEGKTDKYITFRLALKDAMKAGDKVVFMTEFGMPKTVTQEMINAGTTVGGMKNAFNTTAEDFQLHFTAYAIQADVANSAVEAWTNNSAEILATK